LRVEVGVQLTAQAMELSQSLDLWITQFIANVFIKVMQGGRQIEDSRVLPAVDLCNRITV